MTTEGSLANDTAHEILHDVIVAAEFSGREPHWTMMAREWFRSFGENIYLAIARLSSNGGGEGGSIPAWIGFFLLAALIVLMYISLLRIRGIFVREIKSNERSVTRIPEESYGRLRQKAMQSWARGKPFDTLRWTYLAALRLLWERGLLPHSNARTDREFLHFLGTHPVRNSFEKLSALFSQHRYGRHRTTPEDARKAMQLLDLLHTGVHQRNYQDEVVIPSNQAGDLS